MDCVQKLGDSELLLCGTQAEGSLLIRQRTVKENYTRDWEQHSLLYQLTLVGYRRIIPAAFLSQWNPVSVHWRRKGGRSLPCGGTESLYL
jgi:hypothetical protein